MTRTLEQREAAKYRRVWELDKAYGEKNWGMNSFHFWSKYLTPEVKSIIDIGCGTGRLYTDLRKGGYDAYGMDITDAGLEEKTLPHRKYFIKHNIWEEWPKKWWKAKTFDLGVCADVMEHLPEEKVQKALQNIMDNCSVCYFAIAMHSAKRTFGGVVEILHLTAHRKEWWIDTFKEALPGMKIEEALPNARKSVCQIVVSKGD